MGKSQLKEQENRADLAELYELIQDGFTNAEIIEQNPDNILLLQHIDRTRKAILEEKFKSNWRDLDVTYIFGPTGTGNRVMLWRNMVMKMSLELLIIYILLIHIVSKM